MSATRLRKGDMRLFISMIAVLACASLLSACGETSDPNRRSLMSSEASARQQYERSVSRYQNCVAANSTRASPCEWQRNLMEADERLLSASLQEPDSR